MRLTNRLFELVYSEDNSLERIDDLEDMLDSLNLLQEVDYDEELAGWIVKINKRLRGLNGIE
jgi:hypothetical protein